MIQHNYYGGIMKHYKKKKKPAPTVQPSPVQVRIPDKFLPKEPIVFNGDTYVPAFSSSTVYTPWGYTVK